MANERGKGKTANTKREVKAKAKHGESLDLSSTPLPAGPLPSSLHEGLYKLNLSSTSLDTLGFLSSTPSLSLLNLSGNPGLASVPDEEWRAALAPLKGLCVLYVSKCGLRELPSVAGLPMLRALLAGENKIASIDRVRHLPELNTLVVSHNRLKALPSSLTSLPALKKLAATNNLLTSSSLPDLSSLAELREVRLAGNPGIITLPEHINGWGTGTGRGVEILELGSCGIRSWEDLDPLRGMPSLHQLTLKGNAVAPSDEAAFDAYKAKVLELVPSLRILDGHRFDPKFLSKATGPSRPSGPVATRSIANPSIADPSKKRKSSPPPRKAKRARQDEPEDRLQARMRAAEADAVAQPDEGNKASEVVESKPKKSAKAGRRAREAEREAAAAAGSAPVDVERPAKKQKRDGQQREAEARGKSASTKTELVKARDPSMYDESAKAEASVREVVAKTSVVKIVNVASGSSRGKDEQAVMDLFRPVAADEGLGVGTWD